MVNKNRIMAEGFPILSAPVIVLPILKGLSSCGVFVWLLTTVRSILLEKVWAGWEVLPTFPARQGPLCHVNAAVLPKWRPPLVFSGKFQSNLMLLLLVLSSAGIHVLIRVHSILLSQEQNVFQQRATCLTGLSLLCRWVWLWSPDLWLSQRITLLRRCLLILGSVPVSRDMLVKAYWFWWDGAAPS